MSQLETLLLTEAHDFRASIKPAFDTLRMEYIDPQFLDGMIADFLDPLPPGLLARWDGHADWWAGRLRHGIDPYSRSTDGQIAATCRADERLGVRRFSGLNFASQEYLGLAAHPAVHAAAKDAIDACGVHSAGSAALMGNTSLSVRLERELADFLGYVDCTVFPTGWGAGYGAIRTLVTPRDHVLIDVLAHACLQEGARAATPHVHTFPHLSTEAVERRLQRIRREEPKAGILVLTETLFSMDSDVPDVAAMQRTCTAGSATLLVDVAHDLGAIGPGGRGYLEFQDMVGRPDVLMGSFSKTFASNGGFVASNSRGLKLGLRSSAGPYLFTNALSPVQAAIVLKAIEIIRSPEGAERRRSLMANCVQMRAELLAAGFNLLGKPSAIVPVIIGDNALARLMTRYTLAAGALVNLVEHPAVSRNTSRWRIQVMAGHTPAQVSEFVRIAVQARANAVEHLARIRRATRVAGTDAEVSAGMAMPA